MLEIKQLKKVYRTSRGEVNAVKDITFRIGSGEFVTLLGPSGCGKTTTLRCVAGLEVPDGGEIFINGEAVFSRSKAVILPTEKRNIGMVFQSYAIWPHMNVFENVAFPLKTGKRISKSDIQSRVRESLRIVRMEELIQRPSTQLSGGQQQRVALARALVKKPKLLLLDEPLSNLDAKLREDMRLEIKDLAKQLTLSVLYVTHDQAEALAMSDRVLVMQEGLVLQEGSPLDIYHKPQSQFVANFIGAANLFEGQLVDRAGDSGEVQTQNGRLRCILSPKLREGDKVLVTTRPEEVKVFKQRPPDNNNVFSGKITKLTFLGDCLDCRILVESQIVRTKLTAEPVFREEEPVFVYFPSNKTLAIPWN